MLQRAIRLTRNATLAFFAVNLLLGAALAQRETVLYSFTGSPDGAGPFAGVIFDTKGNLYGTTVYGGAYGYGSVFKVTPSGEETVLYSFTGDSDGAYPYAGLVFDKKGNLYGTTYNGGGGYSYCDLGCGTVFKVYPSSGKEVVLHRFCLQSNNCKDGAVPWAGLVFDKEGNLYGTTQAGGSGGGGVGSGTVFKVYPSSGREVVFYSFCSQSNCTDGAEPEAGLVLDKEGNLYGTTIEGGANMVGTVFEVTPSRKETVLYNFCPTNGCADGAFPRAGLVFDTKGNLYGTTNYGGAGTGSNGTVFEVTPSTGSETVLYSFCSQDNCTDGSRPYAGLVFDKKGNLYGTTIAGGANSLDGTVFEVTPSGEETVLHSFTGAPDGAYPRAGLVFDGRGNLYGTTYEGGAYNGGTVFKLVP
jgi:uncharacterized repeat protein (TIGR03803 family)